MANTSERILKLWGRIWPPLETWIVPPLCVHCGKQRWKSLPLCRKCIREMRHYREAEDDAFIEIGWVVSLFRLSPPLRSLIHGFKYRRMIRHIRYLCAHLQRSPGLLLALSQVDCIIPVPLHASRRRERGYNQAELIAMEISRRTGKPLEKKVLQRIRSTSTQTKLNEMDRVRNLSGAFRCVPGPSLSGKRILLVDDVFTTGSTLKLCREELMKSGAVQVEGFVLARVERMSPAQKPESTGSLADF